MSSAEPSSPAAPHARTALAVLACTIGIIVLYLAARRSGEGRLADWLDNAHWTLAYVTAALLAWRGLRQATPTQAPARRWLTLGLLLSAVGQIVWNLQEINGEDAFPAFSDVFFILLGPCNVMAMLAAMRQLRPHHSLTPLTLDVTMLTLALLALVVVLYMPSRDLSLFDVWIRMLYPLSMSLGCCFLLALIPALHPKAQSGWLLYLGAALLNASAWTTWIKWQLEGTLLQQTWLYLAFSLVTLALGWGAMTWNFEPSQSARYRRYCDQAMRHVPLIATLAAMIFVTLAVLHPTWPTSVSVPLYTCAVGIVLLGMVRQSLIISERDRLLQAEQRANEMEQSFKLLFRITRGGLAILEPDGTFRNVNPACSTHLGYSHEQFMGMGFADLQPQPPPSLNGAVGLIGNHGSGLIETSLRRHDGSRFDSELTSALIPDSGGLIFVIIRDITERKRASEELQALTQRLAIATRAADIGIWEYRAADGLLLWDAQMHRMWGTRPETFSGSTKEWRERVHPQDQPYIQQLFRDAIANGHECRGEFRIVRPDGDIRHLELRSDVQLDEHGALKRLVGVNMDITARKHAEALQAQSENQLRQSQRLETIGTLTSGIAHDFNNVLGVIMGNIELAIMDIGSDHPAITSLKEVRKAGQRARDLIKRIVDYGRPQQRNFRSLNLATVIEDSLSLMRAAIPTTVDIHCRLDHQVPPAKLDPSQISQVLLNLCTNAYQAMPEQKGRIDIELSSVDFTTHEQLPSLELQPGRHLCLKVSDNGQGISAEVRPQIFEPFFTTKPPGEGSGLGLSIIRNIVRNHSGAIAVDTEPGKGATFTLYFPVSSGGEVLEAPHAEPSPVLVTQRRQRILYVDDEEALVYLVSRQLQRNGYVVSGITDPHEALNVIVRDGQQFDLIITDQSMPGLSGMELCREILRRQPGARIVMVSGFLRPTEVEQARALGVLDIVFKPDTVDGLTNVVNRLLNTQASGT